jgi:fructose-1-phosphate kinase PfkB-like protein
MLREMPLSAICRFGVVCGAANAMTDLAGTVHPQDVERLQSQLECMRI